MLTTESNLALLLVRRGKGDEAERLYRLLEARRRTQGKGTPIP